MQEQKVRVLLVHNYYQIAGGEDTVVANEKKMLEDKGHQVFLYSRNNTEIKNMNAFKKLCIPFTSMFSLKTYREVKQQIIQNQIDIVHVHNTLTMVSPSVFYAANACNVPVVQTLHNFRMICPNGLFFRNGQVCEECLEHGMTRAVKHGCYRNSKIQTLVSAATIKLHRILGTYRKVNFICLTEFNRQKLLQLNQRVGGKGVVDEQRLFVKPNFAMTNGRLIPYEKRKNQFVFAGRLEEIKGIKPLLEAWCNIEDSDLLLCGTGPLEDWCKEFIEKHQLTNVKLCGFTAHEELMDLIRESKALILPSLLYEGFPMTIAESYACGTPVIGSDIGNIGSLIIDGKNGLKFQKGSSVDLADKVKRISGNAVEIRQIYEDYYDMEANYLKLMQIYQQAGEN